MAPKVLILKNITHENPGLIATVLESQKIPFDLVDLGRGGHIPQLRGYAAMIVLGGPASANDQTPVMQAELKAVRVALEKNLPYLGICLGMQALVKAAGGEVMTSGVREIGFVDSKSRPYEVTLTGEGRKDELFQGLSDKFTVFQLHGETVKLTPSMTLLGEGRFCKNQIVRVKRHAYGIQCHFELTESMLLEWQKKDRDLGKIPKEMLRSQYAPVKEIYTQTGLHLIQKFLALSGILSRVS